MLNLIGLIGVFALFPLGLNAFLNANSAVGVFDHLAAILMIILILYLRKTGNYKTTARIGVATIGLLYVFLFVTGGLNKTGHLWFYTFPLISFFLLGSRNGSISIAILLLASIAFSIIDQSRPSHSIYRMDFIIRFFASFFVVSCYSYVFEVTREKTQKAIGRKNEELLLKVDMLQKADAAIRENEEKYRNLVERANDGIALIQDSRMKYVNPKLSEITGYGLEEMQDRHFTRFLDPAEFAKVSSHYSRRMRGDQVPGKYDTVIIDKHGEKIHVELNAGMINFEGHQADLVIIRDISERKRVEDSLKTAKDNAEAASLAKSEFLANMSHELRTPLNHIIGFTELVVDKKCGDLNDTQADFLKDVLESSRHLLSLINDILDLSKIESGKLDLHLEDANIRGILENSLSMVQEKALKQGIHISTVIDGIPESIPADERKIKQIIYNLLSNAVKFSSAGGDIVLSAKRYTLPPAQDPEGHKDHPPEGQAFVIISVKDSGIGLKQEDIGRIFRAFEQVDSSKTRTFQGTGLGLSLTKELVELHGGSIWAESGGEGRGATFRFILPVHNNRPGQTLPTAP